MVNILFVGCNGKMGKVISESIKEYNGCKISCGVDLNTEAPNEFAVYKSINDVQEDYDVILDFSHPSALEGLLNTAVKLKKPIVVATTGLEDYHIKLINNAAESIPVFFTYNMSIGINLLTELARIATKVLNKNFDIEIVESHHNKKIDAPSGTAIMLASEISKEINSPIRYEFDRHAQRKPREHNEIGIHSIRGGTIVGEHEIIFAGPDEVIKLSHSAYSKNVFATGAINAAMFIYGKKAGLYDMGDLVSN